MTLRHLEIFTEVCHAESITLAAERLNMTQPAVSTVIRDLESYYGVRLFDRMNRRIYITQSGTLLYNYAQSILSQLDDVKELLNENADSGTIRIGSNIAFALAYLSDIIADFKTINSKLSIYTRVQNPQHLESSLIHNELDFAIADKSLFSDLFCFEHLTSDRVGLVCSRAFAQEHFPHRYDPQTNCIPATLSEIAELPLLLREVGSGSRDNIDDTFRNANLSPKIMAESISTRVLIRLCKNGLGITTVPYTQIRTFDHHSDLIEISASDVNIVRNYYLIYHKNKYFTHGMQTFLNHLKHYFFN